MKNKIQILKTKEIVCVYKEYDRENKCMHYYSDETKTKEFEKGTFIEIIPTPFELFGVECRKGWNDILKPIFEYIENYNRDKPDDKKLIPFQIKEKWSSLCVYMNFYTDELRELIRKAENEAENTCELCGSKENVGKAYEGWITTECHECMKKWCVENERPHRWRSNKDKKIYWLLPDADDELVETKEMP